jgi:hypothetical protein
LSCTGSFTGPCATTYRLFKLANCRPSQAAPTVSSTDDLSVGRIEVKLDRVVNTGMQQQSVTVTQAGPSRDAADKKLPEGKKVSTLHAGMQVVAAMLCWLLLELGLPG